MSTLAQRLLDLESESLGQMRGLSVRVRLLPICRGGQTGQCREPRLNP